MSPVQPVIATTALSITTTKDFRVRIADRYNKGVLLT